MALKAPPGARGTRAASLPEPAQPLSSRVAGAGPALALWGGGAGAGSLSICELGEKSLWYSKDALYAFGIAYANLNVGFVMETRVLIDRRAFYENPFY